MPKIKKLNKELSEMIAAGEVVERPSSIIKELLENSIDAGATSITVEIEGGGLTYMRVTDNGCGIDKEDVPTAFLRNATSKISSSEDLFNIHTLGFRGEALSAAAAVAKLDMLTKSQVEDIGSHIRIEGGEVVTFGEAGCPAGTTLIVRDLFYNMPARLKFMKRDSTEAGYISDVVLHEALANPNVSLCFMKNGKREFFSPGDGKLLSVLYSAYGRAYSTELVEVSAEYDGIKVTGFITKPENSRSNRAMQDIYVNGRYIRSKIIGTAVEQAYSERIMKGKFPACLLFVNLHPHEVDVNVHPAKTEVKFVNESKLFNAVYVATKTALDNDLSRPSAEQPPKPVNQQAVALNTVKQATPQSAETPQINLQPEQKSPLAISSENDITYSAPISLKKKSGIYINVNDEEEKNMIGFASDLPSTKIESTADNTIFNTVLANPVVNKVEQQISYPQPVDNYAKIADKKQAPAEQIANPECQQNLSAQQDYKILGELFKTYILVEQNHQILLIDKHAAHERMLFNKLSQNPDDICSQSLIVPLSISLKPSEVELLLANRDTLHTVGFDIDEFGAGVILVRSIPSYLDENSIVPAVTEIAEKLLVGKFTKPELYTKIIERLSCISAVKAHSLDTQEEREQFVKTVMQMPEVKYCPHGRPVAISITEQQLEKMFKRA